MSEILSLNQANQFQPGRTVDACGFFAVASLTSCAPLGEPPIKSPGQIITDALSWYSQYNGDNSYANTNGMSLEQLHQLLNQVKWEWQNVALNPQAIRDQINAKHPVIIAIEEASVFDLALGRNPYPWNPIYNHVILVTGLQGNDFLVRDSASISPPNTLRAGPRPVSADRLVLISATAALPNFPLAGYIPGGWTDKNGELRGSYGRPVTHGMRDYIRKQPNWPSDRVALSDEIGIKGGKGTYQIFPDLILRWTPATGVYPMSAGLALNNLLSKGSVQ